MTSDCTVGMDSQGYEVQRSHAKSVTFSECLDYIGLSVR